MEKKGVEVACAVVELHARESGGYTEGGPPDVMYVFPLTAGESRGVTDYLAGYPCLTIAVETRGFPGGTANVLVFREDARDDALALFARWLVGCDPSSELPTIGAGKEERAALCQVAVRVGKVLLALGKYESPFDDPDFRL